MEDISKNKIIRRANKKKGTVNENLKSKKIPIHLSNKKRSNSEKIKSVSSKLKKKNVINLITKGPSINKLFFKKDNISLKSGSMPKSKKRLVKRFRSINFERDKNEISKIKIKKYDSITSNNQTLNYLNMDFIEKKNNLRGEAKDFLSNKDSNIQNNLNTNQIYGSNSPFKEKEMTKKPLKKIQSVTQEKKVSKFSDFKITKNMKKEEDDDDDESYENINPDDYREGNNIQLIGGNSLSEKNNESSSLSSNEDKANEKKEKKKNNEEQILNISNNNISENEDNYFKNNTNFFRSPKQNSKHPSNKSLKSDGKSDHFNNIMTYFKEPINYNDDSPNKNSLLEGPVNKNNIRKNESLVTNSNNEYDGDIEEYDLVEIENKIINNLNINDSYISQNNNNNPTNNENNNIHIIKNDNNSNNYNNNANSNNNLMNKNNYNLNTNKPNNNYDNKDHTRKNIPNINSTFNNNNNNNKINIDNNDYLSQSNKVEPLINYPINANKSNIMKIQNKNNFHNNNLIVGNEHTNINSNNVINDILNNKYPRNNNVNTSLPNVLNNYNLNEYQGNIRITGLNFDINNYILNNSNNKIGSFQLNQIPPNNNLMNDMNMINNSNRFLYNNSNNFQQNINSNSNFNNNLNYLNNNINNNIKNNINRINNFDNYYNANNLFNLNVEGNNQNINHKINLLNYYNSQNNLNNDINNNMNNLYMRNNNFKNTSQIENLNSYQKQILLNQNMINTSNSNTQNYNYMNQLLLNNYINQNQNLNLNDNINLNNINLLNNMRIANSPIIPNINANLNPNSNINNLKNNNINYIHNYKRIHSSGNLNHIILNNNNININNSLNKKNNYLPNKQKKLMSMTNEELAKQAFILAKNQNECKYLQKKIENNPKLVPKVYFPHILGHIEELSNDQFGNYYINILIKYLPEDMINKFIQLIHPSIPKIGTNQYGTKVLQSLIDFLTTEENILFFIEKTLPHLVTLINDLNGIHIVQRLINVKSKHIQLIYNNIFQNINLIAVTRDGSNFLKRLIDILDQNNLNSLINSINKYLDIIITNQHGNYIIQEIILKNNLPLKYSIIETIIKNIVIFSNQKFSSNVVEKCFEVDQMKEKVIDEILKNNNFEKILLNEYGNYVIQKALYKSDINKQQIMLKLVVPLVTKLQCLPFGQKLLSKLFISYPRLSIYILNSEV